MNSSPIGTARLSYLVAALTTLLLVPALSVPPAAHAIGSVATVDIAPSEDEVSHERLRQRVRLGAYVNGMSIRPARLTAFERQVQREVDVASIYWGHGDIFPGATELELSDHGRRDLLLSWDMGATRFTDWSNGSQDAYLNDLVRAARAYPHVFYVRPWPEMNGDWQSFQPTSDGKKPHGGTPKEFVAAWRYVVDYFRSRYVTNVRWVFNPAADVYPGTTRVSSIWPGEEYVDVLGIDGFNWGRGGNYGGWRSFVNIFAPMYRRLTRLHSTAPVWICEVGSKEPELADGAPADRGRSKGRWIRRAMTTKRFPRVDTLVWFNERKERDWRVNSSSSALKSFRRVAPGT